MVADTNGNAINDINHFILNVGANAGEFYLDQTTSNAVSVPEYWSDLANYSGHLAIENGVRYFDINGDGKADIVKSFQNDQTGTTDKKIYQGNGDLSFSTTTNYSGALPDFGRNSAGTVFTTGLFGEVNGDGFPDYVKAVNGFGGGYTFTGNGSAFATSSVFFPIYQLPTSTYTLYSSSQLVDINGDGLDDWVHSDDSTTYVHLNNGRGWGTATSTQWGIATSTYYKSTSGGDTQYYDRGMRFVDINGDGLVDFVRSYSMSSNSACAAPLPEMGSVKQVFLNTGNGWATSTAYAPGYIVNGWINSNALPCGMTGIKRNELVNWTGNGQMNQDVITSVTNPKGAVRTLTYTPSAQLGTNANLPLSLLVVTALADNDGFGTISTTTYSYSGGKTYLASSTPDRRFAGFAVSTTTAPDSVVATYYHQGTGLNTALGEQTNGYAHINRPFRRDVFDLAGLLKQKTLYRWDTFANASSTFIGLGRELNFDYDSLGGHKDRATEYVYASSTNDITRITNYGEVSGLADGSLTDLLSDKRITDFTYAATTTATTTTSSSTSGNSYSADLEQDSSQYFSASDSASISPTGSVTLESWIKIESIPADGQRYAVISKLETGSNKRSYELAVETTAGTQVRVKMSLSTSGTVVDQYKTSSTLLSSGVWTHIAGVYDANAHSITLYVNGTDAGVTDQAGNISSIYNSDFGLGVGAANIGGTPSQFFDGKMDDTRVWNTARSGSDILNATTTELAGTESGLVAYWKLNNNSNDATANLNNLSLSGSPPVYVSDVPFGSVSTTTSTSTATFTLISVPSQETLTNQSGTKIKETKYYYDGLAQGSVTTGNLTKRESWLSGSTYVNEQNVFNSYGLVASSTDPRGNVATNTYDSRNLYVATSTNALSQTTQFYYDYTLGKPKQTIDANGLVFQTDYDGIDRPVTEKQPDLTTPSTLVTKKTYAYTDTVGSRKVLETNYLDGSTDFTVYKYLDGFDRVIQTRKEAETSNKFSVKDIIYNTSGLVGRETLPYFSTGSSKTTATSTAYLYTTYAYDALKRVLTAANAVGTTTNAYEAWSATTTDANGNPKGFVYDAFKQLTKVIEYDSGTSYATQYEYDALGNLTKITDASANVRNFTYDGRGKRLTAEDIHNPTDGTYGTWTYNYDVAGNLATTTDPKGQVVDYLYDKLNRVLSEDYTGASGTEIAYQYDFCTYGVGRLCTATSTGAVSTLTYNSLGLPATERKTIATSTYATSYSYNRQGNQTNIVYPDNSEVQYTYNTAGLLESIQQKESGGSFADIVSNFDYGPHEKTTFKALANGLNTRYTYRQDQLYRLKNIYTVASTTLTSGGSEFALLFGKWKNLAYAADLPLAFQGVMKHLAEIATDAVFTETAPSSGGEVLSETVVAPDAPPTLPNEPATTTDSSLTDLLTTATSTSDGTDVATSTTEKPTEETKLDVPDRYFVPLVVTASGEGDSEVQILKDAPEVRLKKWNGEVEVTVQYAGVYATSTDPSTLGKATWTGTKESVEAYALPSKEGMEGAVFEIEVVLNEKPDKNNFNFSLSGTDDLDFFYQGPLDTETQDENVASCTETTCTDKEGNVVSERPENVVGSYAVYSKERKDHAEGGKNYANGKIFHIYRPKIIDANGNAIWGTLNYENGTLSVTVPQEFLDKATYPVKVDPTFGYTTAGATSVTMNQDAAYVTKYALSEANATVTKLTMYEKVSSAGTRNLKGLLYSDSAAYPSTLLASSSAVSISNTTAAWQDLTFATSTTLASATDYWLGFVGDTGTPSQTYYYDTGTTNQNYRRNPSSGDYANPPSTYPAGATGAARKVSIYASYTASSTGNTRSIDLEKDSSQYISTADSTSLSVTGSHTLEAWIKLESIPADGQRFAVISKLETGSNKRSYELAVETTAGTEVRVKMSLSSNGTAIEQYKTSSTLLSTGTWTHIAGVYTTGSNTINLYVNGADAGSTDAAGSISSIYNSDLGLGIGAANVGGTPSVFFDGKIDDARIWNTARSASEIANSREGELGGNESGLAGYWRLNNTTDDATANGNTATLQNSPSYSTDVPFAGGGVGTNAPNTPSGFLVEGTANSPAISDPTPEFSAIFNDDAGDAAGWYQIQVSASSTFASTIWDSTKTTLASSTSAGSRIADISYAGTALASTTPYFARLKFWDVGNHASPWSNTSIFSLKGTNPIISDGIQDITYTYDAVGNILSITDTSNTQARNTTSYAYDTLYRLTSAITTVASTSPYGQTYVYDPLGNITYRSDVGNYMYQGTTTGSYANAHAPTNIAGLTVSYDRNGNQTNFASSTSVFDYRNRLSWSYSSSSPTSVFNMYDHTEQRVAKWSSTMGTTTYPSRLYTTQGATSTISKSIFAGDELIATIRGSGTGSASTTKEYAHLDHLGSVNVTTSATGTVQSVISYMPYGGERVTTASSTTDRHFIDQRLDTETNLNYLQNRFYANSRGQFLSLDPVYFEVGMTRDGRNALFEPQSQNSYGYASDNPIIKKDPEGRWYTEYGDSVGNVKGGPTVSYGIRVNGQGIVAYVSVGFAVGPLVESGQGFSSGNIDVFNKSATVSREGAFALGPELNASYEGKFRWDAPLSVTNGQWSTGVRAGVGGRVGQYYTFTIPVYNAYASSFANARTVEARAQVVQSFNAAGGAKSNESKYWTTPNGAIITWDGTVVVPGLPQSTPSKTTTKSQ